MGSTVDGILELYQDWMRTEEIAKSLGKNARTVQVAITKLIKRGYLKKRMSDKRSSARASLWYCEYKIVK